MSFDQLMNFDLGPKLQEIHFLDFIYIKMNRRNIHYELLKRLKRKDVSSLYILHWHKHNLISKS